MTEPLTRERLEAMLRALDIIDTSAAEIMRALLDRAEAAEREAHDAHQRAISAAVERGSSARADRAEAERDSARAALKDLASRAHAHLARAALAPAEEPRHGE